MNSNPLKSSFDRARRASEQRSIVRGLLGRKSTDTAAQCVVTNRPDFLYVRVGAPDSYTVGIARSSGGLVVRANTPVRMVHGDDGNLQILGYDTSSPAFYVVTGGDTLHSSGVPPHTHALNSGMTYEIESLRMQPGRVYVASVGMTATVNGFRYWLGTFPGDTIDLSSYVPAIGLHCWVLVGVNPSTNTLVAVAGDPVITATILNVIDIDAVPFAGYIPLGAFQLTYGDVALGAPYEARQWLNQPIFNDDEGDPAAIGSTASAGSSEFAARRDHVHVLEAGASGTVDSLVVFDDEFVFSDGEPVTWA